MLKNYMKIAWKVLLRRKFFTFISLFGISFTLTILMVITSMADKVFGAHPPLSAMPRVLFLEFLKAEKEDGSFNYSFFGYDFITKHVKTLHTPEKVGFYHHIERVNAYINNKKLYLDQKVTDDGFWEITDFEFLEGRGLTQNDLERANMVIVINENTKKEYFGAQTAYGKNIVVNGKTYQVVGVVKNVPPTNEAAYADVWIPISTTPSKMKVDEHYRGGLAAIILCKSIQDIPNVKEEFASVMKKINDDKDPTIKYFSSNPDSIGEAISRGLVGNDDDAKFTLFVFILVTLVLMFMIIPAMNLININISRIMERSSEIGARKAFGATKNTLVGQFLVENIFVTTLGGIIGLGMSQITLSLLNQSGLISFSNFTINFTVFGFGFVFALVFGILSGVYPAIKMSKLQAVQALKGGAL
jgi:putative ABC transport system permease protein